VMVIDGDVVHQSERKDADGKRMAAVRSRAWSPNPDVVSFDACKRPKLRETVASGGSPTKNCRAVWRCFCEKKERRGCSGDGLYIAGLGLVGKLGFARGAQIGRRGCAPCSGRSPSREGRNWWVGPTLSGGRSWERYPFGLGWDGPWAVSWLGPDSVPWPFYLFFVPFLISYFFYNFCNKASNDFKTNSKIF
jgi:hypothetical protein